MIIWSVGGRAPPRRKPPRTSGSHWPAAAPGSHAPATSAAGARRWSALGGGHHRSRLDGPTCAGSRPRRRTCGRWSRSRPAPVALVDTCLVVSWLQPLTRQSLQESRGDSEAGYGGRPPELLGAARLV